MISHPHPSDEPRLVSDRSAGGSSHTGLPVTFLVADTPLAMDSSIKLCRIAEGSADIYPRHGPTMEWDVAAGQAVLEAGGGTFVTHEGQPFVYGKASEGFRNGWFVARGAAAG